MITHHHILCIAYYEYKNVERYDDVSYDKEIFNSTCARNNHICSNSYNLYFFYFF